MPSSSAARIFLPSAAASAERIALRSASATMSASLSVGRSPERAAPVTRGRTSVNSSAESRVLSVLSVTCSRTLRSSRMFPGHEYAESTASAVGVSSWCARPERRAISSRMPSHRDSRSAMRSRSGGSSIGSTESR